jgi:predicted signal transduction protein with EAL and GGDEF domain
MLISAARRLDACVRGGDTVARLGGDEFAVLMEDVQDRAEAESVAARLVHAIAEPLVVFGEELRAGSSAGVVVIGAEAGPPSLPDVLRRADLALYAAKENGKGQVVTYAEELHVKVLDRAAQKQELRRALDSEQFTLHYQPILEIGPGRIVGAEALVRWNHPDRGLLAPRDFIGLAEESAMIVELGDWVMDTALRQARTWRRHAGRPIRLSVNVSARQLQEPDFVARAIALMAQHGARPGSVIMEITESVLVRDGISAMESMDSLRAAGMQIAIDDFGVGYSSLAYLQDFPIDILKIDKSFIHNLGTTGRRGGALARAVLSLADSLRLEVIAEGIERADQRDELRSMGCVLGQGFLYARPMQHDEFVDALRAGAALGPTESAGDHRAEAGMPSTLHEVPQ